MSSTGESAMKSSSKGKSRASKPISPSDRAGLQFPVARIKRCLKKEKYADRIDKMAPVYLAGVLEYLAIEVLNLAGEVAKGEKKKIIKPRHISLAVQNDTELNKLLENVTIPFSGRGLQIESNLLPKNNAES